MRGWERRGEVDLQLVACDTSDFALVGAPVSQTHNAGEWQLKRPVKKHNKSADAVTASPPKTRLLAMRLSPSSMRSASSPKCAKRRGLTYRGGEFGRLSRLSALLANWRQGRAQGGDVVGGEATV